MEAAICCRAVCLKRDWENTRRAYESAKNNCPVYVGTDGQEHGIPVDVIITWEMWEPLAGEHSTHPFVPAQRYDSPVKLYQCKHVQDGRCSIWPSRPEMCRNYSCLLPGQDLFRQNCGSFGRTCFPTAFVRLDPETKTIIDSAGSNPAKSPACVSTCPK